MAYVSNFRELEVYKTSRMLSAEIFNVTKRFPREEMHSLIDQMRRSARSIGAQVAESWGKRRYVNHFISKLTDADSEQNETQHWIETARDCNYLTEKEATELLSKCSSINKMLNTMISKADQFCFKREDIR